MNNSTVRWAMKVVGGKKIYILWLVLIQAAQGAAAVASAWVMRGMIDSAVDHDVHGFVCFALAVVGIILLVIALSALMRWLLEYSNSTLENRFKKRLFEALLSRNYGEVTATHSAEWLNRMTSDTTVVTNAMTSIVPGMTGMMVKLIGALALLAAIVPKIMYIVIPFGVLVILLTGSLRSRLKAMHVDVQSADGRFRAFVQERLSNLLIVKTFSREKSSIEEASELMDKHQKSRLRRINMSNVLNTGFLLAMRGVYIVAAVYCGYGILKDTLSYGTFVAVLQLINQIQSPFANITGYVPQYYAAIASGERLMEAEAIDKDIADDIVGKMLTDEEVQKFYDNNFKSIGLRNADFTYEKYGESNNSQAVINDFSLAINRGEYVALTGPSGGGKSTVIKLLMCLYELDGGEGYVRCTDGSELTMTAAYRGLFAYVPQGNQLMSGTIRQVITWNNEEAMKDEEGLRQALRIACADSFVAKLECGLDTVLGEGGAGLSEGQMQRIAIARAIYSGHPILLLDEATSSLDTRTESKLLENLRAMTDRTVVIVTHRRAAAEICDRELRI